MSTDSGMVAWTLDINTCWSFSWLLYAGLHGDLYHSQAKEPHQHDQTIGFWKGEGEINEQKYEVKFSQKKKQINS